LTNYIKQDVEWVRRIVSMNSKGITPKDLAKLSSMEKERRGDKIGHRLTGTRTEQPPGREKIYQILNDYNGKLWAYNKSKGNRKAKAVILKNPNLNVRDLLASTKFGNFETRLRKIESRKRNLGLKEFVELYRLKNEILAYPMEMAYDNDYITSKSSILKIAGASASGLLGRINSIESLYYSKKKFDIENVMYAISQLFKTTAIERYVLKMPTRNKAYLKYRNELRQTFRTS